LLASAAILSNRSLTKEFIMDIALEETPASGCTFQDLVDVDGVKLLTLAFPILLVCLYAQAMLMD